MKTETETEIKKPVFKWAWQNIECGDYTDIKEYRKAYKEWEKNKKQLKKK